MTKENIKQICQIYDNFRSERDAATIAYNSDDTFWEHVLATYNLSQHSLPSNLDEAAEEYAYKTQWDHGVRFDAFKAGAEWMACLALTPDDITLIIKIYNEVLFRSFKVRDMPSEILRRFNEQRKK